MVFCWPFFFLLTVARFLGVSFRAFYGRFLVLPKKLHPAIVPKLSPRDLLYSSVPRPAFFHWTSLVPLADVYEKLKITSKQPLTFRVSDRRVSVARLRVVSLSPFRRAIPLM